MHLFMKNGTLLVSEGEDENGYEIVREATVDEEHSWWALSLSACDRAAQRADDAYSSGERP